MTEGAIAFEVSARLAEHRLEASRHWGGVGTAAPRKQPRSRRTAS